MTLKLYIGQRCAACDLLQDMLVDLGAEYETVNVTNDPKELEELTKRNIRTVPVLVKGDQWNNAINGIVGEAELREWLGGSENGGHVIN